MREGRGGEKGLSARAGAKLLLVFLGGDSCGRRGGRFRGALRASTVGLKSDQGSLYRGSMTSTEGTSWAGICGRIPRTEMGERAASGGSGRAGGGVRLREGNENDLVRGILGAEGRRYGGAPP